MALESELELGDVLSGNPLLVQLEQLLPYYLWINVRELDREKHLAVPVQLLEHLCVAVLESFEYLLQPVEHLFLRLARVYPLCHCVEYLLFVDFAIFLPADLGVDLGHAARVGLLQGLLQGAVVHVDVGQHRQIRQFSWKRYYKRIFQVNFLNKHEIKRYIHKAWCIGRSLQALPSEGCH